jgi:riboflavin synthase
MFTGIVEGTGAVLGLERRGAGARLSIAAPAFEFAAAAGDSISVSGCCLTVLGASGGGAALEFDLSEETLERTWLGSLAPGSAVNLERAVRLADRLGGHLVSGHIDGLGRVVGVEDRGDGGRWIEFEAPPELERYLVPKGSVTVDGVSLTVVEPRGRRFGVAAIPATLERTTLGSAAAGRPVHLEADMLGKWIERLLAAREGAAGA